MNIKAIKELKEEGKIFQNIFEESAQKVGHINNEDKTLLEFIGSLESDLDNYEYNLNNDKFYEINELIDIFYDKYELDDDFDDDDFDDEDE